MHRTLRLRDLFLEDLRSLPQARFALPAMALLALALVVFALVVIPSPLGPWSYALVVYGLGPVLLGAFAALRVAELRARGHADALFTMPVRSRTVLLAHLALCLSVAAAYMMATLPFLAVTAYHVGLPLGVGRLVAGGIILQLFAVALGTLVGAFFTGRSVAGPVGLTTAWLFLSMMAVVPNASLQLDGGMSGSLLMRMLHLSPFVLVSDAVGALEPSVGTVAKAPLLALAMVAGQIVMMILLAWRIFVHEQGPQGWDSAPRRRLALLVASVAVLLLAPAVVAGDEYVPGQPPDTTRLGSSSHSRGAEVALVAPGQELQEERLDGRGGTREAPLDATGNNVRDVLILLPVATSAPISSVHVVLGTDPWLQVEPETASLDRGASLEEHKHRWLIRVPVTLTPEDPQGLKDNTYQFSTNITYQEAGKDQASFGSSMVALQAEVPWVDVQLAAAGAPLLLATTGGAVMRRVRVGGI